MPWRCGACSRNDRQRINRLLRPTLRRQQGTRCVRRAKSPADYTSPSHVSLVMEPPRRIGGLATKAATSARRPRMRNWRTLWKHQDHRYRCLLHAIPSRGFGWTPPITSRQTIRSARPSRSFGSHVRRRHGGYIPSHVSPGTRSHDFRPDGYPRSRASQRLSGQRDSKRVRTSTSSLSMKGFFRTGRSR